MLALNTDPTTWKGVERSVSEEPLAEIVRRFRLLIRNYIDLAARGLERRHHVPGG